MVTKEKRLKINYNIALNIVYKVIGKKVTKNKMRPIIKVGISPRAISRYGICKYKDNGCVIEVSKLLFELDDKYMIETLIHEILHTFKDTKGHNYMWKYYANKISKNSEYSIKRTSNYESKNMDYKINIKCLKCGKIYSQHRINKRKIDSIKNNRCRCTICGGNSFEFLSK